LSEFFTGAWPSG